MDTLGQRVKKVIVFNGYTMTQFAKELNISQSMVSKICSDKAIPSERTISDICRIFNVNKEWLMYEYGEMTNKQSLEAELSEKLDPDNSLSGDIKEALVSALAKIPPTAWNIVAEYLENIAAEHKKTPDAATAYMEGYREGLLAAQKVQKIVDGLSNDPDE